MSVADEILKLARLRDQGLLTEQEFQIQKSRLLGTGFQRPPMPAGLQPPAAGIPRTRQIATPTAPKKAKGNNNGVALGFLVALVIVIVVIVKIVSAVSGPGKAAGHSAQLAAFRDFVTDINDGISSCESAASAVGADLGGLSSSGGDISNSQLVQLDSLSKSAQTACDDNKDQALLNAETITVPGAISYVQSLGYVPTGLGMWATDTGHVLRDVQNIAEGDGSDVADQSQLSSDVKTANSVEQNIEAALANAAQRLNDSSFGGLNLVTWTMS